MTKYLLIYAKKDSNQIKITSKSCENETELNKELNEISEEVYANEISATIFEMNIIENKILIREKKPKVKKITTYDFKTEPVSNPFLK